MADKETSIWFGKEHFIDVAQRCADIAYKYGHEGAITEKGLDECAFHIVQDFVEALGFTTKTEIVDDK